MPIQPLRAVQNLPPFTRKLCLLRLYALSSLKFQTSTSFRRLVLQTPSPSSATLHATNCLCLYFPMPDDQQLTRSCASVRGSSSATSSSARFTLWCLGPAIIPSAPSARLAQPRFAPQSRQLTKKNPSPHAVNGPRRPHFAPSGRQQHGLVYFAIIYARLNQKVDSGRLQQHMLQVRAVQRRPDHLGSCKAQLCRPWNKVGQPAHSPALGHVRRRKLFQLSIFHQDKQSKKRSIVNSLSINIICFDRMYTRIR